MAVYDSPAEIKEAGLSEVTLELSATDTAEIMSRLVIVTFPEYHIHLWFSLQEQFTDDQLGTGTMLVG